jgi:hypothetical protein
LGIRKPVKVRPKHAQPVNGNAENNAAKPRNKVCRVTQKVEIKPGAKEIPISRPCQVDEFGIVLRVHLLLTE